MLSFRSDRGFTLIELLIATLILSVVSGVVLHGMLSLGTLNDVVANRTEMHAGVRNATEVLQQEVGQAGRISLGAPLAPAAIPTLTGPAGPGIATVAVSSTTGMFPRLYLVVGTDAAEETVRLTAVDAVGGQITAAFANAHPAGTPVSVLGGFAHGVIPTTVPNGSSGTVLKMVGDINGDGSMVYVEYTCDLATGRLYRNPMPYDAAAKPAPTVDQILLDNLLQNPPAPPSPNPVPCFTYEQRTIGGTTFVTGVAITLTVRTHDPDPVTGQFQTETKALLNVSPRNVFNVWQMASLGYADRVQALPPATELLLPALP